MINRLKDLYTILSCAAGKAEVLDDQVKCFYDLHVIIIPLADLAKYLATKGNQTVMAPLFDKEITIEGFQSKLKMLTSAGDLWETGSEEVPEFQLGLH